MREWYYKNKHTAFGLLVIGALVVHSFIHDLNLPLLAETLVFSLMAFVFFDWMTDATTRKELFSNMARMLKNHHDNTELGFERVVHNAETIPYKQLIQESSEIYICQIYGRTWLKNYQRAFIHALGKNDKLKIHFILFSKENPAVVSLSNLFTNGNPTELQNKIEESLSICTDIHNAFPGKVKITQIDDIPLFGALYVFDNKAIQIPLSTSKKNYSDFLAYEFEDVPHQICGYKIIKRQLEELIN